MNHKALGEKGQRITIGILAKFDIDVAIPLTDNLPWDLILIYNGKLYKAQVKSSTCSLNNGSVTFGLRTNNWYTKTSKKYTELECDIMILCDYENIFLLSPKEFKNRNAFTIRKIASKNGQKTRINSFEDYIISTKRIEMVLT